MRTAAVLCMLAVSATPVAAQDMPPGRAASLLFPAHVPTPQFATPQTACSAPQSIAPAAPSFLTRDVQPGWQSRLLPTSSGFGQEPAPREEARGGSTSERPILIRQATEAELSGSLWRGSTRAAGDSSAWRGADSAFANYLAGPLENLMLSWGLPRNGLGGRPAGPGPLGAYGRSQPSPPVAAFPINLQRGSPPRRQTSPPSGFHWDKALSEWGLMLGFEHSIRMFQEKTRAELGGPFFRDYFRSLADLDGWGDGDSPVINYFAHPMQGATSGLIQIQNDPAGRSVEFGATRAYWRSRSLALAAAALYSLQFELGPLSEATIGNVGLHEGTMAWTDLVMTPIGGLGLIILEDALDRFVITKVERRAGPWLSNATRTVLNPNRSVANLIRFKAPWKRDGRPYVGESRTPRPRRSNEVVVEPSPSQRPLNPKPIPEVTTVRGPG